MKGMLDLETLTRLVEAGEIDTVLVCFPDVQGRLMGKRVTGHFFLDSVAEETHACNYLLTVDLEMEPVPGYEAASWDLGYGDFVIKPDMDTLRRIPWLDGTALVIGDILDHHHEPLPHAPRNILKKQLARLAERGWSAYLASELEFYVLDESYEAARDKRYHGMKHASWYIEDYHIFQTTKEEGLIRAIRNHMDACGIPIETSKGEWGPGQEEINFKYAATLAAGLHGIDNELELPAAFEGNMYAAKRVPDVPKTLREALAAFKKSKVLRAAFGEAVVGHYAHAGEWEQREYDRRITDWELIRNFERA